MERRNKKLTLGTFFRKRAVPMAIIAVVLCIIAAFVIDLIGFVTVDTSQLSQTYMVRDAVHQSSQEDKKPVMDSWLSLMSDIGMDGVYTASVVLDAETGELVGDPATGLFAVVNELEKDKAVYYTCRDEDVVEFIEQYHANDIQFRFDEIYLRDDGTGFRPAKLAVIKLSGSQHEKETQIDERDFTPADLTGYTKTTRKLGIAAGISKDNKAYRTLIDNVVGKNGEDAYQALIRCDENFRTMMYDTFTVDGKKYTFFSVLYYNLWEFCGVELLLECLVFIGLVLLAAFIWAKIAYTKYAAQYESDEYRRTMVNALAHDLKSPLMAISGYAENLQSGAHPDKMCHYTTAILENTRCMNELIESTLELSKLEGTRTLAKDKTEAVAIVTELYEKYRPQAESRGITFAADGRCSVSADTALLRQALENLVANAVKYTDDGGSIKVKADAKSLSVINTFSGSIDKTAEEICRPFVRGDSSRNDHTGTGMGLAIVKNICDMHGFALKVKLENGRFTAEIRF
ncbi:MAG: HAMP domain-containing histidine kinase [Ruminococcaceae bacterium]|nr:HAMP domain-containing histidine kinase [Oscillospiraceae bacterium]